MKGWNEKFPPINLLNYPRKERRNFMAKVTIILEDLENEELHVNIDCDPPFTGDSVRDSLAQNLALQLLQFIEESKE
jgi:hypothetical protein